MESRKLALVLIGGGARAAYEIGVLRAIGRKFPHARFDIITGVSSGAINAAFLASRSAPLSDAAAELSTLWGNLRVEDVFCVDTFALVRGVLGWGLQLISGGRFVSQHARGLVDTRPLRKLLERVLPSDGREGIAGIAENIGRSDPGALGIVTLNYATGQTVVWVEGGDGSTWVRPLRRSVATRVNVEHVMASAALPLIFPAVRLGSAWYGDGGIRLASPLSPALLLGADRILAIATQYEKSFDEASEPTIPGYPPPAQIVGELMNAVFVDMLSEDALRLERSNQFLRDLPADKRHGYRVIDLVVIRPSRDLGEMAAEFEHNLPRGFRFLTRGLGTRETKSPDFLSILLFQPDYLRALIALGESDGEAHLAQIATLMG